MGTAEQKAHRQDYAEKIQKAWDAGQSGQWKNDQELRSYLNSQGITGNPIYNQLFSGGGFNTYGPNWQPGWNYDFNEGKKIPYQGAGEDWYDPSKDENWQNMGPIERERMNSWFKWRDSIQAEADKNNGGNTLAYWFAQHPANTAQSNLTGNNNYNNPKPPPNLTKEEFWKWLYSQPQEHLQSLLSGATEQDFPKVDFTPLKEDMTPGTLGDTKGFDRAAWDRSFNSSVQDPNAQSIKPTNPIQRQPPVPVKTATQITNPTDPIDPMTSYVSTGNPMSATTNPLATSFGSNPKPQTNPVVSTYPSKGNFSNPSARQLRPDSLTGRSNGMMSSGFGQVRSRDVLGVGSGTPVNKRRPVFGSSV
jgi:hypothetical protein